MYLLKTPDKSPSQIPDQVESLVLTIDELIYKTHDLSLVYRSSWKFGGAYPLTRPNYSIFASMGLLKDAVVNKDPFRILYAAITFWNENTFHEIERARDIGFWNNIGNESEVERSTLGQRYDFTLINEGLLRVAYGPIPYLLFKFVAKNGLIIPPQSGYFGSFEKIVDDSRACRSNN